MSPVEQLGGRLLVVFDGRCGLCNRSVRWLLRRDRHNRLCFVPSESPRIAGLLSRRGFFAPAGKPPGPDTILVIRNPGSSAESLLACSDAVVALLAELPRPWPAASVLLRGIPRPLRDLAYRLIARWRYRIWGRLESCPLPTVEERGRFL